MRDILGNVQQLAVPYLVIPQLIAPGLTTFDFATGAVREDYGIENFAYGRAFISGGIQHGLNDVATLHVSAEVAPGSREVTARGGAALRAGRNMTLELTPAVSHAALLGDLRAGLPNEWATQASVQLGPCGSLGALYAWRRSYAMATTAAATLTYNLSLRRLGAVGVFMSNTRSSGVSDVVAGITFTRYFGKGVTAAVTDAANDGAGHRARCTGCGGWRKPGICSAARGS
jgi:hypothetical protein